MCAFVVAVVLFLVPFEIVILLRTWELHHQWGDTGVVLALKTALGTSPLLHIIKARFWTHMPGEGTPPAAELGMWEDFPRGKCAACASTCAQMACRAQCRVGGILCCG